MFEVKDRKRIPAGLLFVIGMAIGALCFMVVYGVRILDFTNTGWLFYADNDLRQHYISWCHYRADEWSFPIGLIKSLSYPDSMSVIYTDSIPLFAVIFKLFAGVLPVTFQYFGLFGIISFMLMGGLSSLLLARFINDDLICLAGSVFYILSFEVLHRMYYHTALAAQWIIVLALVLFVYDEKIKGPVRKSLAWGFMGFICVAIHSYFLPMAGMIMAGTMLNQIVLGKKRGEVTACIKTVIGEFAAFCAAGIATLYILGGFYGNTSASGPGLGTFSSNLNTFVNPMDFGRLMPRLPLYFDFQYEGFGYLGAGVIALMVITAVGMVIRAVRRVPEEIFHSEKVFGYSTLLVFICSVMSATLPIVTFGDKEIIHIPYPAVIEKLLSIFRSNGRLIWVAVYIMITAAVSFSAYTFRRYRFVAVILVAATVVLQLIDMSYMVRNKQQYFGSDFQVITIWDDPELSELLDSKEEVIFLYTDNDITMDTAYASYLHGNKNQNNFYFARDIGQSLSKHIDEYKQELKCGQLNDGAIYVITEDMYREDPEFYGSINAKVMLKYGHIFLYR